MVAPWDEPDMVVLADNLTTSFRRLLGKPLIANPSRDSTELARQVYEAPVAVLSHDGGVDPKFVYANRAAQQLWERSWRDFIGLPSRFSAEPDAREVRARMLARVNDVGFVDDYSGVRISASGRRFHIRDATIWNVSDATGRVTGQAARISAWEFLE